jgi:hypothetical protein
VAVNIHRVCLSHPETIRTLRPHVTHAQDLTSSKIVLKSNSKLLSELVSLFLLILFNFVAGLLRSQFGLKLSVASRISRQISGFVDGNI